MGTLQPFIDGRRQDQVNTRMINHGLKIVRRITTHYSSAELQNLFDAANKF